LVLLLAILVVGRMELETMLQVGGFHQRYLTPRWMSER
jgi:hypothetical protein